MQPKVIKSEDEYRQALQRIDELLDTEDGTPEADELETWSILVEAYEDVMYPIPPPDPVDAILFCMEQRKLRPVDLAPYLGGRSRVSEILNRKRSLSISQIMRLHRELDIPLESLMPKEEPARQSSAL
jgi:HTH-type transcriptional regulator / antitoxin HigA